MDFLCLGDTDLPGLEKGDNLLAYIRSRHSLLEVL
jgi:hypothetical protein